VSNSFLKSGRTAPLDYSHGGGGRVHVRPNKDRGYSRLRFLHLYPEQVETILNALAIAREELGTEYDSVALDAICMNYLANR
jgi:hypothetical protein